MLKIFKQTSVLVFLGLILIIFFPGYAKIQEMRQKNRKLEADIKRLKSENIALGIEKEKLEKDPNYLEQVAAWCRRSRGRPACLPIAVMATHA